MTSTETLRLLDPTELTTKQLHREIQALKELIETRLTGHETIIDHDRRELENRISAAKVEVSLALASAKEAVAVALSAAKEAVQVQNTTNTAAIGKAEISTAKQLDQIQSNVLALSKTVDDKISDVKDRIGQVETRSNTNIVASTSRSAGRGDIWGYIVGGAGLLVSVVTALTMIMHMAK